jgi:hypothetical protein
MHLRSWPHRLLALIIAVVPLLMTGPAAYGMDFSHVHRNPSSGEVDKEFYFLMKGEIRPGASRLS